MGSGVYIKHAVNKYGKHLFEKEILYEYDGISVSALNEVERYYIWLGRSSGKCEYNIASGGIGAVKWDCGWVTRILINHTRPIT